MWAGGAVFAVGVLGIVATVLPLFLDARRLPPAFYWLSMLAPLGLALALAGLLVSARARRRALRRARQGAA